MEDIYDTKQYGDEEARGPVNSQSDRGKSEVQDKDKDAEKSKDTEKSKQESEAEAEDQEGVSQYWRLRQSKDVRVCKVSNVIIHKAQMLNECSMFVHT